MSALWIVLARAMGCPAEFKAPVVMVEAPFGFEPAPYLLLPRPPPLMPEYSLLTSDT